ncbi:MAG: transporter substrate-binding domain-containing protein [Lachnospiraceae bacterium]|jgi:polar amino acid transport system substrate-binding protein|nr:transporter substrate-binding domain-containing protein [Lachnospiraceae bacterium]
MKKTIRLLALCAAFPFALTSLTGCSHVASASTVKTTKSPSVTTAEETTVTGGENGHSSNRLQDILKRGYIEVATEPAFAPNEFIDPARQGDEQYVGSDIELAKYIADKLGVELRLKPMDFTSVLGSISTGKYDIAISALAYTPARAETMNLSKGYYFGDEDPQKAYGILIRKEDADRIKTVDDLADKTLVVQSGSIQELFVNEQIPAYGKLNRVSSTNDALLMVQEGRADAVAAAVRMAELYLDANPESGMMLLADFYFTVDPDTQGTRIGIPKGEDELTDRINEIIDEIIEQDLYNQWYKEYREYAKKLGIEL